MRHIGHIAIAHYFRVVSFHCIGTQIEGQSYNQPNAKLTEDFHCIQEPADLYDYVRLEDINALNEAAGLCRIKIISADGPADYLRPVLNAMDEESFDAFLQYHLATCERQELVGAGAHTVDILRK